MYLLDTDTLTLIHAAQSRVVARRQRVASTEIATSIVTKIEILQGRFAAVVKAANAVELLRAQQLLDRTEARLREITVVPVNAAVAVEFENLKQNKKIRKFGHADLLIACIALAYQATLVTRNLRHFEQIPKLKLENWAD